MGIEFIRSASGRPYVKRWAKGVDRAKTPSLLDVHLGEETRVVTAKLASDCTPQPGSSVVVQSNDRGEMVVLQGLRQVGRVSDPPSGVASALAASHGMAEGIVDRVGAFGTAEIRIK